jgi:4-alpha-glucanotransferase
MSEKKIILGIYSQKPLGTQVEDLEYSLFHCYKPLLTYLYTHEDIKFVLYISIIILEWFENKYPEINMLINDMVKRKQLEMLSGGYYDPILTILPQKDRALQIEMSTTYLRKRFGKRPKGLWITDQIWNPSLISTFKTCGINNVIINTSNKIQKKEILSPFTMQEMGNTINIFPISRELTDAVLTNNVQTVLGDYSNSHKKEGPVTIMLDANKLISEFILHEGKELIGLLDNLFKTVAANKLITTLPQFESESVSAFENKYLASGCFGFSSMPGKIANYNEMFMRYPELNFLYGKLYYSQKLSNSIKKERSLKKISSHENLKGESFGAFTFSDWGGLYHNYLRKENYSHLIEAERASREKGLFSSSISPFDFDFDGLDEFIFRGKNITAIVDTKGGCLAELDYLVTSWNYLDTFVGHSDESLETAQIVGVNGKKQNSFSDIFIHPQFDLKNYKKYGEKRVYQTESKRYTLEKLDKNNREITFSLQTDLPFSSGKKILLVKTYAFKANSIEVNYKIKNITNGNIETKFCIEQNISFGFEGDDFLGMVAEDSQHVRKIGDGKIIMFNVKKIVIKDTYKKTLLTFTSDKRYTLFKNTYNTQINTLFGEEEIYQYSIILPVWDLDLESGEEWQCSYEIRIEKIK